MPQTATGIIPSPNFRTPSSAPEPRRAHRKTDPAGNRLRARKRQEKPQHCTQRPSAVERKHRKRVKKPQQQADCRARRVRLSHGNTKQHACRRSCQRADCLPAGSWRPASGFSRQARPAESPSPLHARQTPLSDAPPHAPLPPQESSRKHPAQPAAAAGTVRQ